ncbi:hypothetical protein [Pantoea agglomerans]|uniref:hypothetical protein n=1 Tax=Enterobacter agglomerans TaxID=549 RepID=UPI001CBB6B5E|nr:hypothetical protein [Pantoea agglomerans]
MRLLSVLMLLSFASGAYASECDTGFNEPDLIASIGKKPEKVQSIKDGSMVRHQYSFRKDITDEEAFDENSKAMYEPQLYVTVYEPPCSRKVIISFYGNDDKTLNVINVSLAGNAYEYLTGAGAEAFDNRLSKLKHVNRFESYDDKADSLFAKIDNQYSIQINMK